MADAGFTKTQKQELVEIVGQVIDEKVPPIVERIIDEKVPPIVERIIDANVPPIVDRIVEERTEPYFTAIQADLTYLKERVDRTQPALSRTARLT